MSLVIIGGNQKDIEKYKRLAAEQGVGESTFFLGPRPFELLGNYLSCADVVVCPRIRGINTPMKVFPCMHSGKPLLATDLRTHNQLLTQEVAFLAEASPDRYADGMLHLAADESLRNRLGKAGRDFVLKNHTFEAHKRRLNGAYDWIESRLHPEPIKSKKIASVKSN